MDTKEALSNPRQFIIDATHNPASQSLPASEETAKILEKEIYRLSKLMENLATALRNISERI